MYNILSYLFKHDKPNTEFTVFFSCGDNSNKINIDDEIIFGFANQIIKTNVKNIEFVSENEFKKYTCKIEFIIPYDFIKNKIGKFNISVLGKNEKIQLIPSDDSIFSGIGWEIRKFEEPSNKITNNGKWEIINNSIYKIMISDDLDKENYITIIGYGFEKDCKISLINNDTLKQINPQWCFSSANKIIFSISKNTIQSLDSGLYNIHIENPSGTKSINDHVFKIMIAPDIQIANTNSNDKIILLGEEQNLYIYGEKFLEGKNDEYVNVQFEFFLNGYDEKQTYIMTNEMSGKIKYENPNVFSTNMSYDPEILFINEKMLCINIKQNNTARKGNNGDKLTPENLQNASIYEIINNINMQEINVSVFLYQSNIEICSFPCPLYAIFNINDITNLNNTDYFDISNPNMVIKPSISQYEEPFVKEYNINLIGFYGTNAIPIIKYFYKNHEKKYASSYIDVIFKVSDENGIHEFVVPHNSTFYKTYLTNVVKKIEYENGEEPAYNSLFIDYVLNEKEIEYYTQPSDVSEYSLNSSLINADNITLSSTYKGQIYEFIKYVQNIKDIGNITIEVSLEFNFVSLYVSSGNTRKNNKISHVKNNAKIRSNSVPVKFINEIQKKNNINSFKNCIVNIGIEAGLDFAFNDYYFSNEKNCFFQKNNIQTRESLKKAVIFAYYAFAESAMDQPYTHKMVKHFYNSMSALLNEEIENIDINNVSLKEDYVLSISDIIKIMDNKSDFSPPFYEDNQPKKYITQELQSDVIKSMVMILRNCEELQELNAMLKPTKNRITYGNQQIDNFTLPSASIHSMCKHMINAIIYYNFETGFYKQIAKVILPETLVVTGANTNFIFAEQIPQEKDYYMLVPYPEIIDPDTNNPISLSYADYGAPILQYINELLKLQNGNCVINVESDNLSYCKSQIAKIMNEWISNTVFLLISDSGKYNGANIYAAPSELYRHYLQTIHSSLIGNPFSNIISNTETIKKNIEEGKQENGIVNKLGNQLVDNIMNNYTNIANAVLKSDPSRGEDNDDQTLFRKGDMLTIFISISGSIGNTPIAINNIFAKSIDPDVNNVNSFKNYIINNNGDRIKPLVYAIVIPLIDDFME
jgi:hypothetical protein